jgi:hypothetical protein
MKLFAAPSLLYAAHMPFSLAWIAALLLGGRSRVAGVGFAPSARGGYLHPLYYRNDFTTAPIRSGARGPRQPVEEN